MKELALEGKKVAILAENLYEDLELWYPLLRMKEEGAEVQVVGSGTSETYKSKHGYEVKVDTTAERVDPKGIDALIIPGGFAPDYLRRHSSVIRLVKEASDARKVIAAICHAGSVLVSARILKGKTVTCYKSIIDDVVNAGATYVDREVVRDGNLITSRSPADLPAFCKEIKTALEEAPELRQVSTA